VPGLATGARAGDLVVLLYHRIGVASGEIGLSISTFDRQLELLSAPGVVTTLDEAIGSGAAGVVITVDDGYRDFVDHAVPLLVRHRVPALLYLATGLVDGDGDPERLSWGMLRDAVSTGYVTIGSHTHNHADLSRADERTAEDEMRRSKDLIEHHLGVSCDHFAFPWAVGSPAARRSAERLFTSAALSAWRPNRHGQIDRYDIGRTPVLRSDGHLFFRAKVKGRLNAEALAYRALGRGPWRPR
jgi:peptidoglycan/xylan/chitin deacetylase (PgdA/CDA1 family)